MSARQDLGLEGLCGILKRAARLGHLIHVSILNVYVIIK